MVFGISVVIILVIVMWGLLSPGSMAQQSEAALSFTTERFGWFYLITALIVLLFCLVLAFGKHGHIRLGRDDDEPEYSNVTWFAMLFSAGMGIGLVFWGVAEPLSHYMNPPAAAGMTPDAAREAMRYSFFHWGLHPWGFIRSCHSLSLISPSASNIKD